jgi:hypothetical protein
MSRRNLVAGLAVSASGSRFMQRNDIVVDPLVGFDLLPMKLIADA